MIYLNEEGILYAVSMCRRRLKYRVKIIPSSIRQLNSIRHMIECALGDSNDYIVRGSRFNMSFCVVFENGSSIDIIEHRGQARGHRAHLLVVDENIGYEIIRDEYRRIECLEEIESSLRVDERSLEFYNNAWRWMDTINSPIIEYTKPKEEDVADVSKDEFFRILSA